MSALRQRELRRFRASGTSVRPNAGRGFYLAVRGWREARLTLGVANGKTVDGADLRLDRSAFVIVMAFVHHVARPDRIPRCWPAQRAKTMHIQPSITMVPLLATILVSPVVQAIGEPSSDARVIAAARAPHADLAVLQAPIGHRQPTLEDLPPWLREKEKPDTGANPTQDPEQRRTPRGRPDDGVPRICEPC
jgi:hypothetical protein